MFKYANLFANDGFSVATVSLSKFFCYERNPDLVAQAFDVFPSLVKWVSLFCVKIRVQFFCF